MTKKCQHLHRASCKSPHCWRLQTIDLQLNRINRVAIRWKSEFNNKFKWAIYAVFIVFVVKSQLDAHSFIILLYANRRSKFSDCNAVDAFQSMSHFSRLNSGLSLSLSLWLFHANHHYILWKSTRKAQVSKRLTSNVNTSWWGVCQTKGKGTNKRNIDDNWHLFVMIICRASKRCGEIEGKDTQEGAGWVERLFACFAGLQQTMTNKTKTKRQIPKLQVQFPSLCCTSPLSPPPSCAHLTFVSLYTLQKSGISSFPLIMTSIKSSFDWYENERHKTVFEKSKKKINLTLLRKLKIGQETFAN